jgi:hypothetical protein
MYKGVLEMEDSNCFGSIGIGNILAENGKVVEAMEVYKAVMESNPHLAHPLIN